jgi:serine/threonine protein kinase
MFPQLVVATALFHSQQLIHHNLKPDNIFIDDDMNVIVGVLEML